MMTFLCQNQSLYKKLISANIISERSTCCHEYHVKMSIIVIEHCLMLIISGVLQPRADAVFLDGCLAVWQLLGPEGMLKVYRTLSHTATLLSQVRTRKL